MRNTWESISVMMGLKTFLAFVHPMLWSQVYICSMLQEIPSMG